MKKILTTIIMMAIMAIMLPLVADAQTRGRRHYTNQAYTTQRYATQGYVYNRPSFYRRHRNVVNVAAGTGAGAILGGLIGGRRGAGIGALLGAGGSALYTYKIKPKQRRY
jgi:outer membrane lipoprotein SlyB